MSVTSFVQKESYVVFGYAQTQTACLIALNCPMLLLKCLQGNEMNLISVCGFMHPLSKR